MKIIRIKESQEGKEPAVDVLPDSAIQKSGKPFFVPDFSKEFRFKTATAVHICRLGKNIAAKFASRYYDQVSLCLAIEASDLLDELRAESRPWALATAFDGSIIVGSPLPDGKERLGKATVETAVDGQTKETGTAPPPETFNAQIACVSRHFTLKTGDLLLIESGPTHKADIGSRVTATADGQESINVKIK